MSVVRDGNCLHHATSLALHGTEEKCYQLNLVAALEMLQHRDFYEEDDIHFTDLINNVELSPLPTRTCAMGVALGNRLK